MNNWILTESAKPTENEVVLVNGGIAQYHKGRFYTGMESPPFQRPIQWEVQYWMRFPAYPSGKWLIFNSERDGTRGWNDGCILWWGPDNGGYHQCVDQAGRYTREEAERICSGPHSVLRMVRESDVLKASKTHTYCWLRDLPVETIQQREAA